MAERQNYPVGDTDDGQLVQVSKLPETYIYWFDRQTLTVSSTAVGLNTVMADNADVVHFTVADAQIRHWLDGTAPSSTVGHLLSAGDVVDLESKYEAQNFRAIRTATDAIISASFGRRVAL